MVMHFGHSLQHIIDKVKLPLHELQKLFGTKSHGERVLLWECYESGQMSEADLEHHIAEDPELAALIIGRDTIRH